MANDEKSPDEQLRDLFSTFGEDKDVFDIREATKQEAMSQAVIRMNQELSSGKKTKSFNAYFREVVSEFMSDAQKAKEYQESFKEVKEVRRG
jgi:hypothetical protein